MNGTHNPGSSTPNPAWTNPPTKWEAFYRCIPLLPVAIAAIVIVSAAVAAFAVPAWVNQPGSPYEFMKTLKPEFTITNLVVDFPGTEPAANARLQHQVRDLADRAEHHFEAMRFFLRNYYTHLLLGCIFGGLSAIALALLTRRGWDCNPCLTSFFLSTTVCTTFFFAFPNVAKMEYGSTTNKVLFLQYLSLLNDTQTFSAIHNYAENNSTNAPSADEFILYLDREMKKTSAIAISLDQTQAPIYAPLDKDLKP
jgi:hypothetical protein